MEKEYDLIIVGSGLYGCVTAYLHISRMALLSHRKTGFHRWKYPR